MIFSERFTTKWHDTDAMRRVRITQMLVYMQEVSNHHMASCGMTLDELRDKKGLAFILSKIRMSVYRPLYAFEDITVQTWTCDSLGYAISRSYRIMRGDEVIADADSTWALIDIRSRELVKGEVCGYAFENEPPVEVDVSGRFKLPKDASLESAGQRRIVYSDLDYNMHMNNTRYPDMLCDFIPLEDVENIKGVFLSYVHEAAFGDVLDVRHALCDGTHYFRTVNGEGSTCLEAELILG